MNFLFISEIMPINTYASEVVFYRHFKLLAENGHTVHILTDQNSYLNRKKDLIPEFHVHILPNRKWYYLPFKPYGPLQKLRFFDYYNFYVKDILKEFKIDRLIGYIHGNFLTAFSAYVQRKTLIPLISFFHDDTNELHFGSDSKSINNNTIKILEASSKVLIASAAFSKNWPAFLDKFVLLYPIPADEKKNIDSNINDSQNRRIGYAGTVYNEIIPALDKFSSFLRELNLKFTIIGNNKKIIYLAEKYLEVTCLPLFNTASEANDYLIDNCQICIIAYPEQVNEMPWIKTCFPSKFIQYCLLGIPTIIIAPKDSALGEWCTTNQWILYTDTYDITKIKNILSEALSDKAVLNQVLYYKENVFNPKKIHEQFESIVLG